MIGLSKLGIAIVIIIGFTFIALIAELVYLLYRRRSERRRSNEDINFRRHDSFHKDLLYYLCWKNQSRIEPHEAPRHLSPSPPELDDDDFMKWQGMYGPSRFLFTIKEEEREDLDSEICSSVETLSKMRRVCLDQSVSASTVTTRFTDVAVTIELNEATPYSTPCASPPYYTPSSSPSREVENGFGYQIHSSPEQHGVV
ncbi:Transmembrane protein [Quillaja saponaria]|uniref:Transmembrane protein n=1 Tax=Quillaja saponaria TaxID=32244 RepID=A0AAD7PYU6_QUISA|nr:Transmembrane protein [Quillaja saponaria]